MTNYSLWESATYNDLYAQRERRAAIGRASMEDRLSVTYMAALAAQRKMASSTQNTFMPYVFLDKEVVAQGRSQQDAAGFMQSILQSVESVRLRQLFTGCYARETLQCTLCENETLVATDNIANRVFKTLYLYAAAGASRGSQECMVFNAPLRTALGRSSCEGSVSWLQSKLHRWEETPVGWQCGS